MKVIEAQYSNRCRCGAQIALGTPIELEQKSAVACLACKPSLAEYIKPSVGLRVHVCAILPTKRRALREDEVDKWRIAIVALDKDAVLPPGAPSYDDDGFVKTRFKAVGQLGEIVLDDVLDIRGHFRIDPRYGPQFDVKSTTLAIDASDVAMARFLSRFFPQIGPKRAEKILRLFGGHEGVRHILEHEIERLIDIEGLTEIRVNEIRLEYLKAGAAKESVEFLYMLPISDGLRGRIIEEWGEKTKERITEDPYELISFSGVEFELADLVGQRLGVNQDDPRRLAAVVRHLLRATERDGHTWATIADLVALKRERFRLVDSQIEIGLRELARRAQIAALDDNALDDYGPPIVREGERLFLTATYEDEKDIARHLKRLMEAEIVPLPLPDLSTLPVVLDETQCEAIELARNEAVVILTGGPGTGKSTLAQAIVEMYGATGRRVICCAPTGKAAVRLKKLTGHAAGTIHQTIGLVPGQVPFHSEDDPLLCSAVTIDEVSMVGASLFAHLIRAIPTGARLLIIGDPDQLPSIDAGRVLADLIEADIIPVIRLTKIYRTVEESRIPYITADIKHGRMPHLFEPSADFQHMEKVSAQECGATVIGVVKGYPDLVRAGKVQVIAAQYGVKETSDVQSPIGIVGLNRAIQQELNPAGYGVPEASIGRNYVARGADRVIHCRNDYSLGVMNGEIGYVYAVDAGGLNLSDDVHYSGKPAPIPAAILGEVSILARDPKRSDRVENLDALIDHPTTPDEEREAAIRARKRVLDAAKKAYQDEDAAKQTKAQPLDKENRVIVIDYGTLDAPYKVAYTKREARNLELAYVVSVHRFQGDQAPAIVAVVHSEHQFSLTRAALYTAISRAQKQVISVGTADQWQRSIKNLGRPRRTALQDRMLGFSVKEHAKRKLAAIYAREKSRALAAIDDDFTPELIADILAAHAALQAQILPAEDSDLVTWLRDSELDAEVPLRVAWAVATRYESVTKPVAPLLFRRPLIVERVALPGSFV